MGRLACSKIDLIFVASLSESIGRPAGVLKISLAPPGARIRILSSSLHANPPRIPAHGGAQNRVRVSDGSRGQTALDQLLVHRLDIERADRRQISGAERWPDIPAKQAFGASVAFLPQMRFRCRLKPPIQVFVQSDIRAVHPTAEVMLA